MAANSWSCWLARIPPCSCFLQSTLRQPWWRQRSALPFNPVGASVHLVVWPRREIRQHSELKLVFTQDRKGTFWKKVALLLPDKRCLFVIFAYSFETRIKRQHSHKEDSETGKKSNSCWSSLRSKIQVPKNSSKPLLKSYITTESVSQMQLADHLDAWSCLESHNNVRWWSFSICKIPVLILRESVCILCNITQENWRPRKGARREKNPTNPSATKDLNHLMVVASKSNKNEFFASSKYFLTAF